MIIKCIGGKEIDTDKLNDITAMAMEINGKFTDDMIKKDVPFFLMVYDESTKNYACGQHFRSNPEIFSRFLAHINNTILPAGFRVQRIEP